MYYHATRSNQIPPSAYPGIVFVCVQLPQGQIAHTDNPCPALVIRQGRDWLGLVAVHSDAWLIGLAFYKGARLNKEQR